MVFPLLNFQRKNEGKRKKEEEEEEKKEEEMG